MIENLVDYFAVVQAWLFESIVQPFLFRAGLGEFSENAFEGTEWFLIGILELLLIWLVLRPLEAWIPVHEFDDRRARWNDFI